MAGAGRGVKPELRGRTRSQGSHTGNLGLGNMMTITASDEGINVFFVGVFFQQAILVAVRLCRLYCGPGLEAVPAIIASPNYILI